MEGDKAVDLLADDIDPGEVCIHLSCLFNFKSVLYFLVNTFCLPQLSVSVVFLIWIVSMTGIVSVSKMW
jgi:hypothetical protein